jgi:dipeptidyl aminopeptidase/acylaminoacyl peptidase
MSQRPVHIEDLLLFRIPTDLQISPDGHTVAWVERWVDSPTGKTCSSLMWAGSRPARPLTAGKRRDVAPRFSPDGSQLVFLRREIDSNGPAETALMLMPTDGGEARPLLNVRGDLSPAAWAPDSRWLVVAFRQADPVLEGEKGPLTIRVKRLPYKTDSEGYLPQGRYRLYRVDTQAAAPELCALCPSEGDFDDNDPVCSPDGRHVAFLSNRRPSSERDLENRDVFLVEAGGGVARQLTHNRGSRGPLAWSSGSDWLAYCGFVGPRGHALGRANLELYRLALHDGAEESLSHDLDRCVANLTMDDVWGLESMMPAPAFTLDGRALLVPVTNEGATWLGRLPLDATDTRRAPSSACFPSTPWSMPAWPPRPTG